MTSLAKKSRDLGPSVRASFRPEWRNSLVSELEDAVKRIDIGSTEAGRELDSLSSHTEIDGIYAMPESAVYQGGRFFAPASISVTLNYGGKTDAERMTDTFPAEIEFHIEGSKGIAGEGKIVIDGITVDTRSFFS
jgi:Predicted pPIWI-associating nuclease